MDKKIESSFLKIDEGTQIIYYNSTLKMSNVLIVGDAGVGKTTFITVFEQNEFNELYIDTRGMKTKNIQYKDITFTVSEFAGQEKYGFKNKLLELNVH